MEWVKGMEWMEEEGRYGWMKVKMVYAYLGYQNEDLDV